MAKGVSFIAACAVTVVIALVAFAANQRNLVPAMHVQTLTTKDTAFHKAHPRELRIAVLSDLHVADTEKALSALESLTHDVLAEKPDLVVLLGDYTQHPRGISDIDAHRTRVMTTLEHLAAVPTFAVLGNYETWSGLDRWRSGFMASTIMLLHNEVVETAAGGRLLCIRGLGDVFSKQFRFTQFPAECQSRVRISITHDPAGAFQPMMSGIVLAGHTHCGQVRLPLTGALWVPSAAPENATCGVYEDSDRLLWVSAGVGTSVMPLRLGAPAQWDLLTLTAAHGD